MFIYFNVDFFLHCYNDYRSFFHKLELRKDHILACKAYRHWKLGTEFPPSGDILSSNESATQNNTFNEYADSEYL